MAWALWGAILGGVLLSAAIQEITGYAAWGWGLVGAIIGAWVGLVVAARRRSG